MHQHILTSTSSFMNHIITFTRPAGQLKEALTKWFHQEKVKPLEIHEDRSTPGGEMWLDADDTVAAKLYRDLKSKSNTDGLMAFYWAVFPEGTIWGSVRKQEKDQEQNLRKLCARPGDVLSRLKAKKQTEQQG